MVQQDRAAFWETRFARTEHYVFGEAPNAFLVTQAHRIKPGMCVLAVADGEGRNGVFLASLGAAVHATEISAAAIAKAERPAFFAHLKRALKPGGVLLLQGYRPEQRGYNTGGPPEVEQLYTEAQLREVFADMEIVELRAHDSVIEEGAAHSGMSALIDLVAIRPETAK
jgi:hypothetical protein